MAKILILNPLLALYGIVGHIAKGTWLLYYLFKNPSTIISVSIIYFLLVSYLLWQALRGIPFIK